MTRIASWTLFLILVAAPLASALAADPPAPEPAKSPEAAKPAFDIELQVDQKYAKNLKIEKPTVGKNFGDHVVSYLRILPVNGNRTYPVFINTHNYLTCPGSDKKTPVDAVKQVSGDRRSGVKVLGFFFGNPGCEKPTFHMEPVLAES